METTITNKIYIKKPTQEIISWANNNLIVDNPVYLTVKKLNKSNFSYIPPIIKLFVKRGDSIIIPRGCLYALWKYISQDKYTIDFNEPEKINSEHFITNNPIKLYDYQEKALNVLLEAKSGVLQASTGAGKTEICTELIHRIGERTLILVHTKDLLYQMRDRLLKYYPKLKIGLVTNGDIDFGEDITIATWQTLSKIDEDYYKEYFNNIVIDECHHLVQNPTNLKLYGKIVESIKARYTFGLTATPYRSDSLVPSMYALIGLNPKGTFEPVVKISREDCNVLTAQHFRVDTDTPSSYYYLDEEGKFEYNELIYYLSNNEERNKLIVDNVINASTVEKKNELFETHFKDPSMKRKQIVLCEYVEQAKIITNLINESGKIKAVLLVGSISKAKREEILRLDKNGEEWDVIVATYSLAKEGLDLPILSVLHFASPQKNKTTVTQSVGRIERVMSGKPEPYILDYVDNKISYCIGSYKTRTRIIKKR